MSKLQDEEVFGDEYAQAKYGGDDDAGFRAKDTSAQKGQSERQKSGPETTQTHSSAAMSGANDPSTKAEELKYRQYLQKGKHDVFYEDPSMMDVHARTPGPQVEGSENMPEYFGGWPDSSKGTGKGKGKA
jgi:hypothetical protein